ncbi:DNA-binding protein [Rhizobium leguminosarum]|uniref:DNA-binding protein n=1 Tax=Rhizobium leguminosarum TaxID=384 RepID=UPI001C94EE61|nr:DNA-binding protein [Rhizobium leguminosarum]MBY5481929.1 DNA-binding protein [Rhizobium leguminosarum]
MTQSEENTTGRLDLIWGVEAIADLIGRTPRQTFHILKTGQLPGKKVGGRWVAERSKLIAFFMEAA